MTSRYSRARVGPQVIGTFFLLAVALHSASAAEAQITTDASWGRTPQTLIGPNFMIGAELGQTRGSNLFHSFGQFNVQAGQTATFTGPSTIANIVSRVTGGQQSFINGGLSVSIPNANLFLLNPSGVMFGPSASLNLTGSFHVSTADYLRFADGAKFYANLSGNSTLTAAPPAAFGFLSPNPKPITVEGSVLQVADGQTLSLVGGDIQITGGALLAPGGRVQIASVGSPVAGTAGEVALADLNLFSFARGGTITISEGSLVDVSGDPAGTVLIRGGNLVVNGAFISAITGDADALGGIDIRLTESVELRNGAQVGTQTFGAGRGGNVEVEAANVTIDGALTSLSTQTFGSGAGGDLSLNVETLRLTGGGTAGTVTSDGTGRGGNATVTASNSITIAGRTADGSPSTLTTATAGPGDGGQLNVITPSLVLDDRGSITSSTSGGGRGGDVNLDVSRLSLTRGGTISSSNTSSDPTDGAAGGNILVRASGDVTISGRGADGNPSQILSSTCSGCTVSPGDIALDVGTLTLTDGALIQSGGLSFPQGGPVTVSARDSIAISNGAGILTRAFASDVGPVTISASSLTIDNGFISTSTIERGNAGAVAVNVGTLRLLNGGQIASNSELNATGTGGTISVNATEGVFISGRAASGVASTPFNTDPRSGLFSTARGAGAGGDVTVQTGQILITDGATISARSTGTGNAGGLTLVSTGPFHLENSTVTTQATTADGGNISVRAGAGSMVDLVNSQITTSVQSGRGQGGNITIDPHIVLLDHSQVRADAFGGPGGNINIVADIFLTNDSIISASSALSTPGIINIQAQISDLSSSVVPLPSGVLQAATLLRASCAARVAAGRSSSLVVGGREGLPPAPGGYLPSLQLALDWSDNGPSPIAGLDGLPQLSQVVLDSKCSR